VSVVAAPTCREPLKLPFSRLIPLYVVWPTTASISLVWPDYWNSFSKA
jgi:hypothetical protein